MRNTHIKPNIIPLFGPALRGSDDESCAKATRKFSSEKMTLAQEDLRGDLEVVVSEPR